MNYANIKSSNEFLHVSSRICGDCVSLSLETRKSGAAKAKELIANAPKFLRNSPHLKAEFNALEEFSNNA